MATGMRWLKIFYNGFITPVGMYGPLATPVNMDERVAWKSVVMGYDCFEVDMKTKKEIKLTLENFKDANRFGEAKVKAIPVDVVANNSPSVSANKTTVEVVDETVTPTETSDEKDIVFIVEEEPSVDVDINTIDDSSAKKNKKKNKK